MAVPLVSVILFAHRPYAKFLSESLKSILDQSYSSLEITVLSDGSDEVKEVVGTFGKDERLNLFSQGPLPFLQAANQVMKECKGEYLGTWNSDDIYNEDHVKLLTLALEEDRGIGAAFDNTEYFSDSAAGIGMENGDLGSGLMISKDRAGRLARFRLPVQVIFRENFMTGPSSLIRKAAFEKVGGYDPNTFLNCDLHWFYRIGAYFPVRFVDYVGVRKRIHPMNNTAVNPHYEYGVKELEDIRLRYPDVYSRIGKRVFSKKLGRKYFRLGLYYEGLDDIGKARQMYKKAMQLRKLSFRYSWEYFRSTLRQSPR